MSSIVTLSLCVCLYFDHLKLKLVSPHPTYHTCRSTLPPRYQYMWLNIAHTAAATITLRTCANSGNSLQSANIARPNTAVECGCRVWATALSSTQLHSYRTLTTSTSTPNLTSFTSSRNPSTTIPPFGLQKSSTDLQTSCGYMSWFVRPGLPKLALHEQFWSWNLVPNNKSLRVTHSFISTLLLPTRLYSRLLQNAANKKPGRRIRVDSLLLIDENGSNLGVMDRKTALQLADSKGVQIIQVRKETPESEAFFRLVSRNSCGRKKSAKNKYKGKTRGVLPRRLLFL